MSENKFSDVVEKSPLYIQGQFSLLSSKIMWGRWDLETNPRAGLRSELPLFLGRDTGQKAGEA